MSERDSDLDQLLAPLHGLEPTSEQLARWVQRQPSPMKNKEMVRWALQLAVAACVGFIVGAITFHPQRELTQNLANNFDSTATVETIFIKGE